MLYKKRSEPLSLQGQQSLINRLPSNHQKFTVIEEDLRKRKAGFGGELNFDKHINEFRPTYPFGLLHDICLQYNGIYFQMDSVLILPDKIIIFEIKNFGGKLTVKANPTQFIQENKGERKIIQSPITELERKIIFMDRWLKESEIDIPVKGMIGLAYTNELFIEEEPNIEILSTHEIPIRLYNMAITEEKLSRNKISKIARDMVDSHQEYNPFPLTKTLNIAQKDIMPGVICPKCNRMGMTWNLKKWRCSSCFHSGIDCHLPLLDDWFNLMESSITNRQFRGFSGIQDQDVAKRILKRAGLIMRGTRRTAFYMR